MNAGTLRTLLWLRLRLTRNQWARSSGLGTALAVVVTSLVALAATGAFVGGLAAGKVALGDAPPAVLLLVWGVLSLGFGFAWFVGLIAELQRSELIDVARLMHLPVRLRQLYAVNYVASHAGFSVPAFGLGALGLALGSASSRGAWMLLTFPAFLAYVVAVTAWSYCFQGWIATQVTSPRRRRILVMSLSLGVVVLGQLPNLLVNVGGLGSDRPRQHHEHRSLEQVAPTLELAATAVPLLWPGAAAESLGRGEPGVALFTTLGLAGIAALGLRRGYRGMLRYYQGEPGGASAPRAAPTSDAAPEPIRGRRLVERSLPGVHPQTSAVALASLRSMLRAPEAAMMFGVSVLVSVMFAGGLFLRARGHIPAYLGPALTLGAMGVAAFVLTQFLINQYGLDRDALRTFILAPVPRHRVVLGKSLAVGAVCAVPTGIMLLASTFALRLSPLEALAALLQWLALLLTATLVGALVSMVLPFRISPGSMKASKPPPGVVLGAVFFQLAFPALFSPVALGPAAAIYFHVAHWPLGALADLVASAAVLAMLLAVYRLTLKPLGRLLQRRETRILAQVTTSQE